MIGIDIIIYYDYKADFTWIRVMMLFTRGKKWIKVKTLRFHFRKLLDRETGLSRKTNGANRLVTKDRCYNRLVEHLNEFFLHRRRRNLEDYSRTYTHIYNIAVGVIGVQGNTDFRPPKQILLNTWLRKYLPNVKV